MISGLWIKNSEIFHYFSIILIYIVANNVGIISLYIKLFRKNLNHRNNLLIFSLDNIYHLILLLKNIEPTAFFKCNILIINIHINITINIAKIKNYDFIIHINIYICIEAIYTSI